MPVTATSLLTDNKDVACYLVTKHSWKGKYKRVFSVGTSGVTTYNPQTLEVTNQWSYSDFVSIHPSVKAGSLAGEFSIQVRPKGKKTDTMRFSSEYSPEILTSALSFAHLFADAANRKHRETVNAYKQHWSDSRVPTTLQIGEVALKQLDNKGQCIALYEYKDIYELVKVSDCAGGFCVSFGEQRRLHLFTTAQVDDLLSACSSVSYECLGVAVKVSRQPITIRQFAEQRLGRIASDINLTSVVEFQVQKESPRHSSAVRRLLCLSEACLLERDPQSYAVVTIRQLIKIHRIIRSESNPQLFQLEYECGRIRTYYATERDTVLAAVVDGVRASGNVDVHVKSEGTDRPLRMLPYKYFLDEDAESACMRALINPSAGCTLAHMIRRFNANIPYSGLLYSTNHDGIFSENKERLIVSCLQSVVTEGSKGLSNTDVEAQLQCLHRLFASKAGYHAFTAVPGLREKLGATVITALRRESECVNHAAVDMLCALLQPMHNNYELRQEQLNKNSLLASDSFLEHLLDVTTNHVQKRSGALVISSFLDFLTYALCVPYSETTSGDKFDMLLDMVAARGRLFYKLFQFPSMTIVKGAGLVMRAIIEESTPETSSRMQALALNDGAYLRHLHCALFTTSKEVRQLTNRQLSRHLIAIWTADCPCAMQLLQRCLVGGQGSTPAGLLRLLESKDKPPVNEDDVLLTRNNMQMAENESARSSNVVTEQLDQVHRVVEKQLDSLLQHWKLRQDLNLFRKDEKQQRPVVLRKRRERVKSVLNWPLFNYQFQRDHSKPDLVWNHKTREELREALELELRALNMDKELTMSTTVSWNHNEFEVQYGSLADQVRIGDYFLRNLLEEDEKQETATPIANPTEFFNAVYHHYLIGHKQSMRVLCLQAMKVVYNRHADDIGVFNDLRHLLHVLRKTRSALERDHLLLLLSALIHNVDNARAMISADGVSVLLALMPLAHLHVSRALAPNQTNVLEAAPDAADRESAPEWYYTDKDSHRHGPISIETLKRLYAEQVLNEQTKCWASGLDGWSELCAIPQLLWTLVVPEKDRHGALDYSQLCVLCLDMLITCCHFFPSRDSEDCIVRPVPRVKKYVSQPSHLAQVVQLLLTFDANIVERTATLVLLVMQDNPLLSRLYLSGVFYFIVMYTGSNVRPIARLLHYAHLKQAFKSELPKSDIIQCSIMAPLLPEAMIYYLENYGAEKYAQVFLGEFDNPEAIWNAEMRRHLISRMAAHIEDYSVRLAGNVTAVYQYCPVATVEYAQLDEEMFCHIYYLRHLCDTNKFPDWTIKQPVEFLKACLSAWHDEIERKAATMSVEEACAVLNIDPLTLGESSETVIRKAYFKLAAKYHPDKNPEGRDMFEQINTAYEYLCSAASRRLSTGPDPQRIALCLRAQSIVYQRNMNVLAPYKYAGYSQLIKTIQMETDDDALFSNPAPLLSAATELCHHTLACSALNAEQLRRENGLAAVERAFSRCAGVLSHSSKQDDLAVTHLIKLSVVAAECVCAMAVCNMLQTLLFQAGALWHMLPPLFKYDYTLEEGGVSTTEDSNQQHVSNKLARVCCEACAALAGYREGCPEHDGVQNALRAMLTPALLRGLADESVDSVLKQLNSNSETPQLIWHNGTRTQLLDFVNHHRTDNNAHSELFGGEFKFDVLENELVIGDVYVRVYNQQPTFPLNVPKQFCADVLDYLKVASTVVLPVGPMSEQQSTVMTNGHGPASPKHSLTYAHAHNAQHTQMALLALANVLKANPGIELMCIGHLRLLLQFVAGTAQPSLCLAALNVVSLAAGNNECVDDLAATDRAHVLLMLAYNTPAASHDVLSTLFTLCSNARVVKHLLESGGLLYLLQMFCNTSVLEVRTSAAELLSKLQSDKLTGPRWSRCLQQYLPCIFADAIRDSAQAAVALFDSKTENPELIWSDTAQSAVTRAVTEQVQTLYALQCKDVNTHWKPPTECVYGDITAGGSELLVAGVYVRLFVAQPSWVLRAPRQFLTELMQVTIKHMKMQPIQSEQLETLSRALTQLLAHQPALADQLPSMGYLPQLCSIMRSCTDTAVARSCLLITHQMARSEQCVHAFAQLECIAALQCSMKLRPDLAHSAAQTLRALYASNNTQMIKQALDVHFIEYLLTLLGSRLAETEQPAAVKAEIVHALKSMADNQEYGPTVQGLLDKAKVWREYKDQSHELFLQRAPEVHALTAGAGTAGYLTQGLGQQTNLVPPPP